MRVEPAGPVVLDTNVWISAFLVKTGAPAALVRHLLAHARPVFSAATFEELATRLWRPKLDRYLSMDERKLLLHDVDAVAHWVDPPKEIVAQAWCRDAADGKFIHAALAAGATLLVSGDDDLLCLHPLRDLRVLTSRAALVALT
jgi:uncharacterized protein